ncbi:MAG: hypothetical protein M1833_004371 [Piccolia ochrophora]|nr:MAG: hypothetical protein M1833_004371 [Piccolia ochrophora]
MSALSRRSRTRSKQSDTSSESLPQPDPDENLAPVARRPTSTLPSTKPPSPLHPKTDPSSRPRDMEMEHGLASVEQHKADATVGYNGIFPTTKDESFEDDGRSSSLSDIEDGREDDRSVRSPSALNTGDKNNDSEAETERLENTPQKQSSHKDFVLGVSVVTNSNRSPSSLQRHKVLEIADKESHEGGEDIPRTSTLDAPAVENIVSATSEKTIEAPSQEDINSRVSLTEQKGHKRKRPSSSGDRTGDEADVHEPASKRNGSIKPDINGANLQETYHVTSAEGPLGKELASLDPLHEATADDLDGIAEDNDGEAKPLDDTLDEIPIRSTRHSKSKKGRRKGRKTQDVRSDMVETYNSIENQATPERDEPDAGEESPADDVNETLEDGEGEIYDEEGEAEAAARNEEELLKKRSALDSLSAIEKNFAAFRDRLYEDRMAQLNIEEASLTGPNPTHPEYLAMLGAIDTHRDKKLELEQKILQYKMQALEVKTVAERSQIHSQFFQTIRAAREQILEEIGEQWYQIQRDRRGWGGGVPDYAYQFPTRRSQQITQQTAYNLEVSVLSGVAKYVGFPAAPTIDGGRSTDIEDDLQSMGIKTQQASLGRQQSQSLRTSLAGATLPSRKPAAEEQFLEQTPWANPRHPAHQQHLQQIQGQQLQQQRIGSPFATPLMQIQKSRADPGPDVIGSAGYNAESPSKTKPDATQASGIQFHTNAKENVASFEGREDTELPAIQRNEMPNQTVGQIMGTPKEAGQVHLMHGTGDLCKPQQPPSAPPSRHYPGNGLVNGHLDDESTAASEDGGPTDRAHHSHGKTIPAFNQSSRPSPGVLGTATGGKHLGA